MLEANPIIKRHSRLGIWATIIGAGLPLLVVFLLSNAAAWDFDSYHRSTFAHNLRDMFLGTLGIVFLVALPLHLVGLIFALVGFFSRKTKRGFPIAGIILNALFGLLGIGIGIFLVYLLMNVSYH